MDEFKTVESAPHYTKDALFLKQRADVDKMRVSLLSCDSDPSNTVRALRNIAILQIQHQFGRIIRFLDMMDQIEDKLYDAIGARLDTIDEFDPDAWMMLMSLQSRLQKNIIESNKLLEPYIGVNSVAQFNLIAEEYSEIPATSEDTIGIDKVERDRLRIAAQQVISSLTSQQLNSTTGVISETTTDTVVPEIVTEVERTGGDANG